MGSKTKKTTQKTELPSWVTDASKKAIGMGEKIADRKYQSYDDQRVAGLSQNEQAASELARTGFGSATDHFKSGAKALGGIQSWTSADRESYMNPYIESVVNRQQRDIGRGFDSRRSELARTSSMRGAFGGGRQTALESGLDENYLEATGDAAEAGYASAFDRAQDQFNQEQQRKISEAAAFGSLGSGEAATANAKIGALADTGKTERSIDQAQKDFDYSKFIERRDWDVNNLAPLLAAIQGAKHGQTSTTTEKTSGGELGALAGLAATAASAYMTGGASLAMGAMSGGGGLVDSVAGATSSGGMLDSLSGSWTNAAFGGGP